MLASTFITSGTQSNSFIMSKHRHVNRKHDFRDYFMIYMLVMYPYPVNTVKPVI